jgi:hypothetical protein
MSRSVGLPQQVVKVRWYTVVQRARSLEVKFNVYIDAEKPRVKCSKGHTVPLKRPIKSRAEGGTDRRLVAGVTIILMGHLKQHLM